jgi:predicted AlkP superfamily phosphohydrolase/phosphomutase/Flp pilus assembly protein TadD
MRHAKPKRVLLVGWDSADWNIITPLLERGELPALSSLIDEGVMGKLASLHPIAPIITWTTIATGKTSDKHGILGGLEPDPESGRLRPVTGKSRRAKALWQITSDAGLPTHVCGWFGADPAEEVNGIFAASGFATARVPGTQSVYPPSLYETLAGLRMQLSDVSADALVALVPRAREIDQRYDDRLARIACGLSICCSIHNAATWALEHQPWKFAAIYYNAIGAFSEVFMPYRAPRMRTIGETEFEIYRDVVDAIYRFQDRLLARLIELAGEETAIVLVSGNGFESGDRRPERTATGFKTPSAWFTDQGILCMRGPGIRKDDLVHGANVADIAPTVLALLGLPVGEDMDGKVILDAFEEIPAVDRVASWEAVPQGSAMVSSADARGLAEQFIAFGAKDLHPTEQSAAENLRFNLVCVYMSTGRPSSALPILEPLLDAAPEDVRYQRALAQCYVAVGRFDDAERLLSLFLAGHETHPWMHFLMGVMHMHREHLDPALQEFQKAGESGEKSPAIYSFIGNVYLAKRLWSRAEQSFEKALTLDADHAAALTGMSAVRLRQRREEEAADHALHAVRVRYEQPAAHYQLGVAMARMGHHRRAVTALEAALSLVPEVKRIRRYLSQVKSRINPVFAHRDG